MTEPEAEPVVVGKPEIAKMLSVERSTPQQWVARNKLPEPDHPRVNGFDAWFHSTIRDWAITTGRWPRKHGS